MFYEVTILDFSSYPRPWKKRFAIIPTHVGVRITNGKVRDVYTWFRFYEKREVRPAATEYRSGKIGVLSVTYDWNVFP